MPSTSERTVALVIEDEAEIATQIARRLETEGWQVHLAHDGHTGGDAAATVHPDIIVLDVMLPGIDGLEVCRRIQSDHQGQSGPAAPILMLTARDDETDMLIGLGVGADDYMTKPFSMRELMARLKVLLRRVERARAATASPTAEPPLHLGDVLIDRGARRVSRSGEAAHLTPTEFDLLVCLAQQPGTVLSRERLLAEVGDWAGASGTRRGGPRVKALPRH